MMIKIEFPYDFKFPGEEDLPLYVPSVIYNSCQKVEEILTWTQGDDSTRKTSIVSFSLFETVHNKKISVFSLLKSWATFGLTIEEGFLSIIDDNNGTIQQFQISNLKLLKYWIEQKNNQVLVKSMISYNYE